MNPLAALAQNIKALPDNANEGGYYRPLQDFLEAHFAATAPAGVALHTVAEQTAAGAGDIGFPDITVRKAGKMVGWVEVKLPRDDLAAKRFDAQFARYRGHLENILFTNLRQWALWQWDGDGVSVEVATATCDVRDYDAAAERALDHLLARFFDRAAFAARTPRQLALGLARKARLLSRQVEARLENGPENDQASQLHKLKHAFSETLIQHLSAHQFANMVAETLAYALFLAALERSERQPDTTFDLTTALRFLPGNMPILQDLFDLANRASKDMAAIRSATQSLVDQLNAADLETIRAKLVRHKPGEDAVIQFYEPFLKEYDATERKARGVYYTPKPVVDFIMRGVDDLLESEFGVSGGLADENVTILDPAAGTGTFLMTATQLVHARVKREYKNVGLAREKFNAIVERHIMRDFYGFELLVAPYVIAHLKLSIEARRLGYTPATADARFQIYLCNTLDNPQSPVRELIGFPSISQEGERARDIKNEKPVLAIVGNPPYSGVSQNPVTETINGKQRPTWIGELLELYKYTDTGHFGEKKHWLGDDYVKFLRFAQWKIAQKGKGVVAMITNNNFLDNPTFRGMRYQLMRVFDEIYCLNLHGSSMKKETSADGGKDENVFDIRVGVGVTFFVKKTDKPACAVFSHDMYGLRADKFAHLERPLKKMRWRRLRPAPPHYFFVRKDFGLNKEYEAGWKLNEVFPQFVTGVVTARDSLVINFTKQRLERVISRFIDADKTDHQIRQAFFAYKKKGKYPAGDSRGWKITKARESLRASDWRADIRPIAYRPFDRREILHRADMVDWKRAKLMRHMLDGDNVSLMATRSVSEHSGFNHVMCCRDISEGHMGNNIAYVFPLYLYADGEQNGLLGEKPRKPNLGEAFMRALREKLGKPATPSQVFYYAYAILHCPGYRARYAEQLRVDFPRLPLTGDKRLFVKLVKAGHELVGLHLLGENPLDKSKSNDNPTPTIFADKSRWRVTVGGATPGDCQDWEVTRVDYRPAKQRVYINSGQYIDGIAPEVWAQRVGGYQVPDKWLKDRKRGGLCLSPDDLERYLKIIVALRETRRLTQTLDRLIEQWPLV